MPKRIAIVRKDKCNPQGCGNYLCMRVCPVNRTGKECIVKSEDNKVKVDEELCIGCKICEHKCPFEVFSIINLPEAFETAPLYRYGPNMFSLYSLPTPVFGKVVGILGRNGIGKSTAIKILAGVTKPNFGEEKEASFKEIIDFFKGTETQAFFEKIRDNKIKVSYKPQNVDLIPRTYKGTVKQLLKKVDEKKQLDNVVEKLELTNFLDTDISQISGGELQRVAIAATVLKNANLYIFDEPTSYLDIKQRLKMSRFLKELADKNTSVIVIEHDLIVLDYMADLIHIMYGNEGCFGIVSLPKATKTGVNVYLEGYLKEENIRFRDSKIQFEVKPPSKSKKGTALIEWPEIEKKLGNFRLKAEQGSINRKEIVGVLGENGIGKTTFVKILAGVLKPDNTELDFSIKIAYKPQYLDNTSEQLVMNVLKTAIEKHTTDLVNPLEIKPLLMKQINQLSGGELQRVAIAHALSQGCELVLLDEPSAYLDVEQRLVISKVIRNLAETRGVSILVVDHDLLFLDYLSDRLLVFEGKPASSGIAHGPFSMEQGMNALLQEVSITLRRDEFSGRPRINKLHSQMDQEQKREGKYYYA